MSELIQVYRPQAEERRFIRQPAIEEDLWPRLYSLATRACEATMKDSIDVEQYLGDYESFQQSREDLNIEVEALNGRRAFNQEYHGSRLAVAFMDGKAVGWAYTSHNVSGGGLPDQAHNTSAKARAERTARRPTRNHNFLQLVEGYTDPDYQDQGVATDLFAKLTRARYMALPWMAMSTYIYPGIYKPGLDVRGELRGLGFYTTGKPKLMTVGGVEEVERFRMQAANVASFRRKLLAK